MPDNQNKPIEEFFIDTKSATYDDGSADSIQYLYAELVVDIADLVKGTIVDVFIVNFMSSQIIIQYNDVEYVIDLIPTLGTVNKKDLNNEIED